MSFSTKKDPASMKLRVSNMNINDVQNRTKQLEDESRKMEDRLAELKLAMSREKEMREQRGGGYWKSGKEGKLNSHAKDILNKTQSKPRPPGGAKPKKVKILQNEPITTPKVKTPPKPGTMAFLAQRDLSKPNTKSGGPICGQCDIKSAAVICQECSEHYCSGCFTAFHLKGALAKHHSLPVTKSSVPKNSVKITPRPTLLEDRKPQPNIVWQPNESTAEDGQGQQPFEKPIGHSLLDGEYNEEEAAQAFQQALSDWRKGDSSSEQRKTEKSKSEKSNHVLKEEKIPSRPPVESTTINIDEGTSTSGGSTLPQTNFVPEFHSDELSYADRLLLRKHRRSDAPHLMSSPRLGDPNNNMTATNGGFDEDGEDNYEEIKFESILASVLPEMVEVIAPEDNLGIVEISEVEDSGDLHADEESQYIIQEVSEILGDDNSFNSSKLVSSVSARPPLFTHISSPAQSSFLEQTTSSLSNSLQIVDVSEEVSLLSARSSVSISNDVNSSVGKKEDSFELELHLNDVDDFKGRQSHLDIESGENQQTLNSTDDEIKQFLNRPPSRPKSSKNVDRPSSRITSSRELDRPPSRITSSRGYDRPPSRQNKSFHISSRPQSRAERAAEYYGPGHLTKAPSAALKDLISSYKTDPSNPHVEIPSYKETLGEFLTAGVSVMTTDRVLTPSKNKQMPGAPPPKYQLSNKVYAMSGKTWRPGSSSQSQDVDDEFLEKFQFELQSGILTPREEVKNDPEFDLDLEADQQSIIRYTWSGSQERTTTTMASQQLTTPASKIRAESRKLSPKIIARQRRSAKNIHGDQDNEVIKPIKIATPRAVTPIVVDGEDMSQYDDLDLHIRDNDDQETIDDLELELASQTGRLTADGRISRVLPDMAAGDNTYYGRTSVSPVSRQSVTTPETHRHIDKLRESMMDDFEENELLIMQDEAMRVSLL